MVLGRCSLKRHAVCVRGREGGKGGGGGGGGAHRPDHLDFVDGHLEDGGQLLDLGCTAVVVHKLPLATRDLAQHLVQVAG